MLAQNIIVMAERTEISSKQTRHSLIANDVFF